MKMHGRWTMSWLLAVWSLVVLLAAGCLAQAQTLTSVAASNVTAWSAALHGTYDGLITGRSYEVFFYYGQTDAGTNHVGWSNSSSGATISPADTNEAAGAYSRTVVELTAGTQYWFRAAAIDLDSFDLLMATQSLTFTTRGSSPTAMPQVIYMTVVVDTNGVLQHPANFFEVNGIFPTSGVSTILSRLGSNETAIALKANKLDADADYLHVSGSNLLDGALTINSGLVVRTNASIGGDFFVGNAVTTTSFIAFQRLYDNSFIWQIRSPGGSTWTNGTDLLIQAGSANAYVDNARGGDVILSGGVVPGAGTSGVVRLNSTFDGGGNTLTNIVLRGATYDPNVLLQNGPVTASTLSLQNSLIITNRGSDTIINYTGFGNLVIMNGSVTNAVFLGNAVVFPNQSLGATGVTATNAPSYLNHVYAYNINGNGVGVTNIPVTGLRLLNTYTGGVMRLVTTDGVNFFLQ